MQIRKFLKFLLIGIFCIFCISGYADETNAPLGETAEYGNYINPDNAAEYNRQISTDITNFQNQFESNLQSSNFVPIEVRIGTMFMQALSAIDHILQSSLVRFTIIFLFIMYAFWIGLESYKLIRESNDYKVVLYDLFKKGIIIAIWVMILNYGPAKVFNMLISPILALSAYISDFIMDAVAGTFNLKLPNTCGAIHDYVNAHSSVDTATGTAKLLIDADAAANIMCLPGRISVYFYKFVAAGLRWMISGFGHSITAVLVGAACIFIFVKCIFKYAFMTLGVVANLFLTLLMLPFTAMAEAMPATKESNYAGQVFSGLLKIFNTRKLSDVILTFINAGVYFISLAIVISICAALLAQVIPSNGNIVYSTATGMTVLLTGCFILYLANKADELATQIGGKIDNSIGKKLQGDAKTFWSDTKKFGTMIFKTWLKK